MKGDLVVDIGPVERRAAKLGELIAFIGSLLGERLAGIVVLWRDVEFLHQRQSLVVYRLVIALHILRKGDDVLVLALLQRLASSLDVDLTRSVGDVGDLWIGWLCCSLG